MRIKTASSAASRTALQRNQAKVLRRERARIRRATVALSARSQEIVQRFRTATGSSTSAAIDQIIQRSEPGPSRLRNLHGLLVLRAPAKTSKAARRITLEDVKRAEEEADREYVERILYRDRGRNSQKAKRRGAR